MDMSKHFAGASLDISSKTPLYLQIANYIAGQIINNIIPACSKLPPDRELAAIFTVSRTTAINAYHHLEELGFIETKIGSGTYVSKSLISVNSPLPSIPWAQLFVPHSQTSITSIIKELLDTNPLDNCISFGAGMPDPALYPLATFREIFEGNFSQVDPALFGHIPIEGLPSFRLSLATMLSARGIPSSIENTLVLSGSQQGIHLLSSVLLERGDYVILQSPTYLGAIQIFQAMGSRILTLPVSDKFPLDTLEEYLIRYKPKMLYLIPTYQNPSGRSIDLAERRQLLSLAAKHRLVIVEDDPYSQLYYEELPPPPLKSLDTYGGVVYLSTFSKILFPGLRIGFLSADPALVNRLAMEKQYVDLHSNNFTQWLLYHYFAGGHLDKHLSYIRTMYRLRRNTMAKSLKHWFGSELSFTLPEGGFYIWPKLQSDITASDLLHEAKKAGVYFVPGKAFYPNPIVDKEMRLCFTTHTEELISEGIARLADKYQELNSHKKRRSPKNTFYKPLI